MTISLPATSLNHRSEAVVNSNANRKDNKTMTSDSPKNCPTSCLLKDPIALRMPTSRALFSDLAVLKFIDLRDNGGGSPAMVSQIESYFFPVKTHMNDIIDRKNGTEVFWTDPSKSDSVLLQQPVYILTSRHTFSGAEDFSYGMQSVHRAVIVGNTTGGDTHPVGPVPVGLGFVAAIPFARTLNPYTHTDWEGTGVIPDIPARSAGALEAAEKTFFTTWSQTAATGPEKAQAQWQLDDLLSRSSQETQDPASLIPYIGTYQGGLFFYSDQSGFYCRNAERSNQIFKLIPESNDKFILDENVHVEFTKDDKGNVTGIDMWWSDGRKSHKPKEK
jgi:hypothetical protein